MQMILYTLQFRRNCYLVLILGIQKRLEKLNLNLFPRLHSAYVFLLTIVLDAMAFRFLATLLFELGKAIFLGFLL